MLTIEQHAVGFGITVLYVQGRITLGRSVQELEWKVDDLLKGQVKRVVFDLAGVSFLDNTGVGIIVMCAAKHKHAGGSLRISSTTGAVSQTLEMCRIPDVVPMFASLEQAAKSFAMAAGAN
jgi:anti-sigma B factor antagonist